MRFSEFFYAISGQKGKKKKKEEEGFLFDSRRSVHSFSPTVVLLPTFSRSSCNHLIFTRTCIQGAISLFCLPAHTHANDGEDLRIDSGNRDTAGTGGMREHEAMTQIHSQRESRLSPSPHLISFPALTIIFASFHAEAVVRFIARVINF